MVTERWTPALLLSLTFLLGLSLGYIMRGVVFRDDRTSFGELPFRSGPGPGMTGGPTELMDRLARSLDLSEEQHLELDRILESGRTKMMAIRREVRPRQRAIEDSVRTAIDDMLTEEQRFRIEDMRRTIPPGSRRPAPRGGGAPF